ncbi:MAG: DNA cytosine methyltransferase [Phycisphaeraceae bacterium]|nr:DNA cytosine methyltransferase [Phycisphaeraceae bacterium]
MNRSTAPASKLQQTTLAPALQNAGSAWKVLDLCCGLGGISFAAREFGCLVVGGVDLSSQAIESFQHNFPDATAITGSVAERKTLDACRQIVKTQSSRSKLLIVSGPPCQGFSVAGPRTGRDPRNRVLMSVARAIVALSPDAALIENVAALMSKRYQRHFSRFKRLLSDAGFHVVVLALDAAHFGVPQHRHRMICFASKAPLSELDISSMLLSMHCPSPSVQQALAGLRRPPVYKGRDKLRGRQVANHVAMRHCVAVKQKIAAIAPGKGPMSYRKLHPSKPSRTLISGNRAPPAHPFQARSITVREAARLQGFPDTFEVKGRFSNQMLHVTNAVPPPLALAVIRAFLTVLEKDHGRRTTHQPA